MFVTLFCGQLLELGLVEALQPRLAGLTERLLEDLLIEQRIEDGCGGRRREGG